MKKIFVLVFMMLLVTQFFSVVADETESFCFILPGSLSSISLVKSGFYTAASGYGSGSSIYVYGKDTIIWSTRKNASSVSISPNGDFLLALTSDGLEYYDLVGTTDPQKAQPSLVWVPLGGGWWGGFLDKSFSDNVSPKWKLNTLTNQREAKIFEESLILLSDSNKLSLLTNKGSLLWDYNFESNIKSVNPSSNKYIGVTTANKFYLFNKAGVLLWSKDVGDPKEILFDNKNSRVLLVHDKTGIEFSDITGNILWKKSLTNEKIKVATMSDSGKHIVIGTDSNNLYFFVESGDVVWKKELKGMPSALSISSDGKFMAVGTSNKGGYYLFDWNGNELWNKIESDKSIWHVYIPKNANYILASSVKYMDSNQKIIIEPKVCYYNLTAYAIPPTDLNYNITSSVAETVPTTIPENQVIENAQNVENITFNEEIKKNDEQSEIKNTPFEEVGIFGGSVAALLYIYLKKKK
ncbi:MAG: PQQ-binding-like beta-propeller repeat protein [Candidatus Methanofastidiosum sp.]|nr:PQQ-binding-like beta-propeller repeat protein [Methanofastidiosum sp.]